MLEERNNFKETIYIQKAEEKCRVALEKDNILLVTKISEKENFEQAARKIYNLIYKANKRNPNIKRTLVIEIEGHRVKERWL